MRFRPLRSLTQVRLRRKEERTNPSNKTMIKKCIRCNKPIPYDINYPVDQRLYYIEGSGQLCEECWNALLRKCERAPKSRKRGKAAVQSGF